MSRASIVGRALALGLVLLGSPPALASGFSSAEFGGEHGNVVTTNPTALYFNPAGITLRREPTFT